MEFKALQEKAVANAFEYGREHGLEIDEDFAVLKLYEEVGEFAQAVLVHKKKSRPEKHVSLDDSKAMMADELADVVGMAMLNASLFGIDLESALRSKRVER